MEVSTINQDSIVNVTIFGFLNMKGSSFVVDTFEDIVDVIVYYSHSVQPLFCSE